MRTLFVIILCGIAFLFCPLAFAQVQDLNVSVEQFSKIKQAKEDVNKIKKGVTTEAEILKWFGKDHGLFYLEEPVTKDDEETFHEMLLEYIPEALKPQYPFPTIRQKILVYVLPWTFEHPVTCQAKKGQCSAHENLVILVTVDKKTGRVQEFKLFDFNFESEFKSGQK